MNLGGARPPAIDRATHGQPSKYSFCIGENQEDSPWQPLHEERGMPAGSDAVTVFAGENPHNINDHRSTSAEELLQTFAASIAIAGCNNVLVGGEVLVVIGPEHAATIAASGFGKAEVREFLFERAVIDVDRIAPPNLEMVRRTPDGKKVLVVDAPEQFVIVVAGGSGRHSAWLPSFGKSTSSVTVSLAEMGASIACSCEVQSE
jgi:hypothetical protein